jgi:hypothetical protein
LSLFNAVDAQAAISAGKAWFAGDKNKALTEGWESVQLLLKGPHAAKPDAAQNAVAINTVLSDTIHFSGCRDDQTSADAHIDGKGCGAMSWAFQNACEKDVSTWNAELLC